MVKFLFSISSFFKTKFMFKRIFYVVLLFTSATTTQCSKTTVDPNGLPPETQTGAGTFACLINGAVWQYKNADNFYTTPKTRWEFDPNYLSGYLYIGGARYSDGTFENDALLLAADSLNFTKEKNINLSLSEFSIRYINYTQSNKICGTIDSYPADTTIKALSSGKLNITRLDQTSRIISGTFYCSIKQVGCDTLKITNGRFDLKY